jgi:hypothetical protein
LVEDGAGEIGDGLRFEGRDVLFHAGDHGDQAWVREGLGPVFAEGEQIGEDLWIIEMVEGCDGERADFGVVVLQEREEALHRVAAREDFANGFVVGFEILGRVHAIGEAVVKEIGGGEEFQGFGGAFEGWLGRFGGAGAGGCGRDSRQ